MKQDLIKDVIQGMLPYLNNAQNEKLQEVLKYTLANYEVTEKMLQYFIEKAMGKRSFVKPTIAVCVPSSVTEVEKRAVEDATRQAGARRVHIIEEPIAAAIGSGIDISRACGSMVVDIGGGTADIAVISLSGVVESALSLIHISEPTRP